MRDFLWASRNPLFVLALVSGIATSGSAHAVDVPVSSSNSAAWSRSDGGTGTVAVGGSTPGVWNSTFAASIPPASTAISFTLDSFSADDKGVVQLNGTTIGDATIFIANGAAGGAGVFDFGLGGGSQAYSFVGFTPGTAFPLADGTTAFTLVVYMNDTSSADPMATPHPTVPATSSFSLSGNLAYQVAATETPTPTTTATPSITPSPSTTPSPSLTPTITNTPIVSAPAGPPGIPTLSMAGGAMLALLLAALAILVLARSRA
jgi:type VI secretion system secreted protein VgrG